MLPLHLHTLTHESDSQTLANVLSTCIITETPSLALLDTPAYIYTTFTRTLKSICGYKHTHTYFKNQSKMPHPVVMATKALQLPGKVQGHMETEAQKQLYGGWAM